MSHHLFWSDIGAASKRRLDPTDDTRTGSDTATALKILNQALKIADLTVLLCKRRYHTALRYHSPPLAAIALEHANDAKLFVDRLSERIVQLGGKPEPPSDSLPRMSPLPSPHNDPILAIIAEHIVASHVAVESYEEFAAFFAPFDASTHKLLQEIAAGERERGDDLARLRDELSKQSNASRATPELMS